MVFICLKRTKSNNVLWRCIEKNCPAKGKSCINYYENLNTFVTYNNHNHEENKANAIRKTIIFEMKRLIDLGFESIRQVVSIVLRGSDSDVVIFLKKFGTIYKILRDYKAKKKLIPHPIIRIL